MTDLELTATVLVQTIGVIVYTIGMAGLLRTTVSNKTTRKTEEKYMKISLTGLLLILISSVLTTVFM